MRWAMLALMLTLTTVAARQTARWRARGDSARALRCYRRGAWGLGLTVLCAMLVQETVLLAAGALDLRTGLPLHLCSAMGVCCLPMLLSRRRWLWHAALYLGAPGALAALVFPAVLPTPWPCVTEGAFFLMHAALAAAPILPLGLGLRPEARGAWHAAGFLAGLAAAAAAVNEVTGANYLFLNGLPLEAVRTLPLGLQRAGVAALAALILAAEAGAAALWPIHTRRGAAPTEVQHDLPDLRNVRRGGRRQGGRPGSHRPHP